MDITRPEVQAAWEEFSRIIVEVLELSPEDSAKLQYGAGLSLENDLGADSLDHTEIIMSLEETFNGIEIADDDAITLSEELDMTGGQFKRSPTVPSPTVDDVFNFVGWLIKLTDDLPRFSRAGHKPTSKRLPSPWRP